VDFSLPRYYSAGNGIYYSDLETNNLFYFIFSTDRVRRKLINCILILKKAKKLPILVFGHIVEHIFGEFSFKNHEEMFKQVAEDALRMPRRNC
jgi:hypothetical protein